MSATEIGRRLKKARLDAGLTQNDVAQRLGITYQAISNYERGTNRVDTTTLSQLCDIYGIEIVSLLRTPAWNDDMFEAYNNAKSAEERQYYISLWGCPAELIEKENNRREPDANPLTPEDEYILYAYHNGLLPANIIPMPNMRKIPLLGKIACGAPILAEDHIEEYIDIPKHIHADFALTCQGDSMINARIFDGDIVYIRQQDTVESGEIAAVLIDNDATLKRIRIFEDHVSLEPENPQYRPIVLWGEEMNTVRILGKAIAFTSAVR